MPRRFYARLTRAGKIVLWIFSTGMIFLVLFLLLMGIFHAVTGTKNEGSINYRFGTGSKSDKTIKADRALYCPDGVFYFDFTRLAKACSFTVAGDETRERYLFIASDGQQDSVTFFPGSCRLDVNGTFVYLSAPVRKIDGVLYVPCEFIERCMHGVTAETDRDMIRVTYDLASLALTPDMRPIPPIGLDGGEESSS